jgi:hypothetical protein
MKLRMILAGAAITCLGFATAVLAQTPVPEAEAVFQQFLNNHPEVRRNPSLMQDPAYLSEHPKFANFLRTHPYVNKQASRMGARDANNHWHDANWWHQNDPNWVYQHHPEWNTEHPQWMNDGDYDDSHDWHDRNWWVKNHPNWVKKHHPNWAPSHGLYDHDNDHHGKGHAYGHYKDHGHGSNVPAVPYNDQGQGQQNTQGHQQGSGQAHGHGHDND